MLFALQLLLSAIKRCLRGNDYSIFLGKPEMGIKEAARRKIRNFPGEMWIDSGIQKSRSISGKEMNLHVVQEESCISHCTAGNIFLFVQEARRGSHAR